MTYDRFLLTKAALEARLFAYAPYSGFLVGAALLDTEGTVHVGCNVENLSFSLTLCAERTAVVRAVAMGRRQFVALAIAADSEVPLSPCGACRQFLAEFAPDLPIHAVNLSGTIADLSLTDLLPRAKTGILGHP
jgi:cytidine deaminase